MIQPLRLRAKMAQRGLFLDLDGTLADSLSVMRIVYGRFLQTFGKAGCDAEFDRLNGPPLAEIVAELVRVHALQEPVEALLALYWRLIEEAYREVRPAPGARDLLQAGQDLGARVAVVTSSASGLTWQWLRDVGLDGLVDVVVGGDDVSRGKPAPEPYVLALERTGCVASASVAVEDSVKGAQAALGAGLSTLLIAGAGSAPPSVVRVEGLPAVEAFLWERWRE